MSNFVPGNYDLRTALIFCCHLKKTAAESHRMLVEACGEHALGKSQCFEWFTKFRSGNFDVRNEERGRPPKKFQDSELQALLDEVDAQTQQLADQLNVTREAVSIRLKAMGKIQKMGKLCSTWTEWKTAEKSKNHLRNAAHQIQKILYKNSGFIFTCLVWRLMFCPISILMSCKNQIITQNSLRLVISLIMRTIFK